MEQGKSEAPSGATWPAPATLCIYLTTATPRPAVGLRLQSLVSGKSHNHRAFPEPQHDRTDGVGRGTCNRRGAMPARQLEGSALAPLPSTSLILQGLENALVPRTPSHTGCSLGRTGSPLGCITGGRGQRRRRGSGSCMEMWVCESPRDGQISGQFVLAVDRTVSRR